MFGSRVFKSFGFSYWIVVTNRKAYKAKMTEIFPEWVTGYLISAGTGRRTGL
jgi:hypothetical protein